MPNRKIYYYLGWRQYAGDEFITDLEKEITDSELLEKIKKEMKVVRKHKYKVISENPTLGNMVVESEVDINFEIERDYKNLSPMPYLELKAYKQVCTCTISNKTGFPCKECLKKCEIPYSCDFNIT